MLFKNAHQVFKTIVINREIHCLRCLSMYCSWFPNICHRQLSVHFALKRSSTTFCPRQEATGFIHGTSVESKDKATEASNQHSSISESSIDFPSDLESDNQQTWRGPARGQDQTSKAFRPHVDPASTSLLLFPGQGSQFVGMGKGLLHLKEVNDLFSLAADILRFDLRKLCLEGPIETLNRTEVCQAAVFVCSIGALVKLREQQPEALDDCVGAAGFSVGEYAALVFAGVLSFEDALEVVRIRSAAMQAASDAKAGALMTVFLKHDSKLNYAMLAAREYCRQRLNMPDAVCQVANYLFPEACVIGGNRQALDFIKANAQEFNIKRVKDISVSGAFHTAMMKPAVATMREALDRVSLREPVVPVHSNVTCASYRSPVAVRKGLLQQLYMPVKWEQTMHALYQRPQGTAFPRTFEVGPGTQLGTILKMVNRKAYSHYHSIDV